MGKDVRILVACFSGTGNTRLVGEAVLKDFKVIKNRCIGCGRCVRECPDDNLGMRDGKAAFLRGNDCLRCMRCIGICLV